MRDLPYRLFSSRNAYLDLKSHRTLVICVLTLSCWVTSAAFGQAVASATSGKTISQTGDALAPQPGTATQATFAKAARAADGVHRGIKVNGDWKIDTHNPDGTLAKHLEFENSLTTPETLWSVTAGDAVRIGNANGTSKGNYLYA